MGRHALVDKQCKGCGTLMVGVACNRQYCDDCRRIRARDVSRRYYARRRSRADRRKGMTIKQIVREADTEGLSYGQYVAKYGLD